MISQPYQLQKTFQRFNNPLSKNLILQDLQKEIKDTRKEIEPIESIEPDIQEEEKFINLIERITHQNWNINIIIIIQDSFILQTIALVDSDAETNCIQEELIPTKFFEKTEQKLSTANGESLRVKFKISDVHICNRGNYIKQSFILVKDDLGIGIILGQPFLEIIKPFKVTNEGITTKLFQQKILFTFNKKPITKEVNLLKTLSIFKEHSINLIRTKEKYLSNKKFEQQLLTSQIHKKLIRPSKSPLSYAAFYSETPKFVINYKPLDTIRHSFPNKKDLLKTLTESDSTIPFKHYEWNVMSFNIPSKIMNDIFIPYSSFDDILTILKKQHFKYLYQMIQTNDLVLSKPKLDIFITHVRFLGTIIYRQKSILFAITFPDIVTDREQLPISSFIICSNIDSLFLNTNQKCQQDFSRLQEEMESIKNTLSPTEIKKIMSDTLSPTETKEIMSDTLSFTKIRIRFLQMNKTFENLLQNIFPFVLQRKESFKITLSPTEIKKTLFKSTLSPTEIKKTLFPTTMKTLSVQKSFTDKLLFNNSNHTHLDPYKRDSFHIHPIPYKNSSFHSFIKIPETMETLSFDRASPTKKETKTNTLSPTEIEIRNSRAFFFPNTIFKKLRDYNLEEIVKTIQTMRSQHLFNNFQVIQDFLRHIISNPQQFPHISAGYFSHYLPISKHKECPKTLDTCQEIPLEHFSCTCHLAYTIYAACWDLSGPKQYLFQNKIITLQFLLDHGMLQQVLFTRPEQFFLLGRKLALVGIDLLINRGYRIIQASIISTPSEFINEIEPARHLIQVNGTFTKPILKSAKLWDCSIPLADQISHWKAKTIAADWDYRNLSHASKLISEDHIQKIYSSQSMIRIRFEIHNHSTIVVNSYEK
ncbi:hypothetical protein CFOL_v3_35030 [Cephalotus follicularis]|uniref:Retropepsins domain-containing protein n=1 Tax=Cephalotus follicularis TaxID=3775 RepID=A0A1Q3DGL6_CEPFO|nr:hypothetical protein CFOL_v3_35030 [Cephalotus follicularis]